MPSALSWTLSGGSITVNTEQAFVLDEPSSTLQGEYDSVGDRDFARDFARGFAQEFARYFALNFAQELARYFALDFALDFVLEFAREFARYFALEFAQELARYFAQELARELAREFARYSALDLAQYFDGITIQAASAGLPPPVSPLSALSTLARATSEAEVLAVYAQITASFVAEAHAGILIAAADDIDAEVASTYAGVRIHNRWLNLFFDPLLDDTLQEGPLAPQQQALLLAFGLAQFQTTWMWPASQRWRDWFANDTPPSYWLAAHIWHLCGVIRDPGDPAHRTRALACLDRADDAQLVAELRKYPIMPTPPEIRDLYDHPPKDQ